MPKKAWRMSFVFTAENRSQFNLVRPVAVGFQPRTHANLFWQARASLANELWDIELDPLLRGMRK